MRHISRSTGGAADLRPAARADAPADKWRILDRLTGCAADFGLGHRELNVLRALLSFLPERVIAPGAAVVFPSNDTLSERLNGLPESTLRRHLARLVASGLVSRRDSPNRKRYARRDRAGGLLRAFGFDLAPLAAAAAAIEAAADRAEACRIEVAALREELAILRGDLIGMAPEAQELTEAARRLLRRRASPGELRALAAELARRLSAATLPSRAPESSGADSQNERHQQKPNLDSFDSGAPEVTAERPGRDPAVPRDAVYLKPPTPNLRQLAEHCQEARSFFPEATSSWEDVAYTADKIAPMIGVPRNLMHRARAAMGWREAAATVLCLLERLGHIRNPAGYLSHLTRRAEQGGYSLTTLLQATANGSPQIVS